MRLSNSFGRDARRSARPAPCRAPLRVAAKRAVAIAIGVIASAGPAHAQMPTAEQIEFFEKRIRPILVQHCYECHRQDAKKLQGKLLLDSRDGVLKGGRSGAVIVLGKPEESLLITAVRHTDKELKMPPKSKLSNQEIADLETWIKMGAPDPRTASLPRKRGEIDIDEGKKFWSFQPIKRIEPPAVKDKSWPLTGIDRFILARLETKGLKPVGLADARTLIRRATFDLTGLPPSPEQVEEFVKACDSPSPPSPLPQGARGERRHAAYEALIDRLLASPAYGERWGRHWLDVVRYADTAGDNSDYPIPQMYLYRNWVIDAFNRDMPYDQFVREQLAGDLLPSPPGRGAGGEGKDEGGRMKDENEKSASFIHPPSSLIATGYLANSRRHGSYEDARYPWHLTIEDTIDNLGKTFLGVTLHCARCHDHKFDPFTAEDYYALYGFFSSTRYPWPGIELDRVPRDLVPLGSSAKIKKLGEERQKKLAELDAAVSKLEAEKAPADKIKTAKAERDAFAKQPLPYATAYAVIDGKNEPKKRIGQVGNARVQIKGDENRLGKEVPRRFPLVLGGQTLPADVKGSGRMQLANWITDRANPLTARVMVNRIWQYHFGHGIVPTANDFGKQGRPPTHPELLDWLAAEFVLPSPHRGKGVEGEGAAQPGAESPSPPAPLPQRGEGGNAAWSIKRMHRLIMLSRVYQLSSAADDADAKIDPANEFHWRFTRRRLEAESIRDAMLMVSGNLDRTPGGPHPFPPLAKWDFTQHKPFKAVYDTNRRSVYLMTQRIARHPFLALFDGPDTNASTAARTTTTTPLQALFLMNDPFVHEQARKLAARLLKERANDDGRIEFAFLLMFARPPSAEEKMQTRHFVTRVIDRARQEGMSEESARNAAWESFSRALLMSNEFLYVN